MNVIEVVDVPQGASEDEARVLLNRPCETNRYMLVQVFPLPNGDTRAFYRLVARAYDKKPGELAEFKAHRDGKPGERNKLAHTNRDGNDAAAANIIRNNPGLTVRKLMALMQQAGIIRGKTWVTETRIKQRGVGVTFHD